MRGNFVYKKVGKKICHYRRAKHISQEQLSSIIGIHRTYLARIEEGKANPSLSLLDRLAESLGLGVEKFMEGL